MELNSMNIDQCFQTEQSAELKCITDQCSLIEQLHYNEMLLYSIFAD